MWPITSKEFADCLQGFNIVDCSVRDRNIFYFIAREDYTLWPTSKWDCDAGDPEPYEEQLCKNVVIYVRPNSVGKRWTRDQYSGYDSFLSGIAHKPKAQHIAITSDSNSQNIKAFGIGSGERFKEQLYRDRHHGPIRGGVSKMKTIAGWLYLCGGNNTVIRREGPDSWRNFSKDIPDPERDDYLHNMFHDIDGFAEDDIYCVGTDGQVYHFDGQNWSKQSFPDTCHLYTVCCGDDGKVYIGGAGGVMYQGRLGKWAKIATIPTTLPPKDMVWYDGKAWGCNDYDVWTIADGKPDLINLPGGVGMCKGSLSTADGVLLMAGLGGAAFLENGEWSTLCPGGDAEVL